MRDYCCCRITIIITRAGECNLFGRAVVVVVIVVVVVVVSEYTIETRTRDVTSGHCNPCDTHVMYFTLSSLERLTILSFT